MEKNSGPPAWANEKRHHRFVNGCGEVWVAFANKQRFSFTGQDVDWEVRSVDEPDYKDLLKQVSEPVRGLGAFCLLGWTLSTEEAVWLRSIFMTMKTEV